MLASVFPRVATLFAVAAVLCIATPTAFADGGSSSVTLGSVLQTAVRQNPGLKVASIDIDVADAQVMEATGVYDWALGASATWSSTKSVTVLGDIAIESKQDRANASVNLTRLLAGGATFGVHARTGMSQTSRRFIDESVFISYNQPLLRGRGEKVANANVRVRRASRTAAEKDRAAQAIGVVRDVVVGYWELVFALNDLEIRKGSLALAKEQLRLTELRISAGSTAKVESTAVEQTIANREEEILRAELAVTQRSLDLRRRAGLKIGPGQIDLETAAPLSVKVRTLDMQDLMSRAIRFSPELAALRAQKAIDYINVEVTDNGVLPRLDLSVSIGPQGIAPRARDALEQMAKLEGFNASATLTYRHNLGNRTFRGASRTARTRLTRTKLRMADVKAQIAMAVATARKQAQIAQKRMTLSQRAIGLAKKNIKAEKGRFDLGKATNFDVAQRQEELKQFQLRYARATIDYLSSLASIDALTGDLLPRYGIKLSGR